MGDLQEHEAADLRSYGGTEAGFYRAFENRFRGARTVIRARLESYLPFIEPLKQVSDKMEAVDLGCGRGEWLQFLGDEGFQAQGVDLDEGMLASCRKRGLKARKGDALEFLREMPDESQVIVSGFHIAEHLPFPQLQRLVRQAHRVLIPGGLLVLETPNPENFRVSTLSFYTDPTHLNPLPPDLLSFLTEYTGFKRNKIIRLQENEGLRAASSASLDDVLGGASPDYAVVAQKESNTAAMALFDEPFGKEYGLGASSLVERFDRALNRQTEKVEALATAVGEERLARSHLSSGLEEMQSALSILSARIDEERAARQQAEASLAAVHASTSWRLSAPLRATAQTSRWAASGAHAWLTLRPGSRPRRAARRLVDMLTRYVLVRPWLTKKVKRLIRLAPPIVEERIRSIAFGQVSKNSSPRPVSRTMPEASGLSARGREIHALLSLEYSRRKSG